MNYLIKREQLFHSDAHLKVCLFNHLACMLHYTLMRDLQNGAAFRNSNISDGGAGLS